MECAAWVGDRFLVSGLNEDIYESQDGQTWTVALNHSNGFSESIAPSLERAFVVGGSNFIMEYDYELNAFLDANTPLDGSNALMDVAVNGGNVVVVGFNHTVIGKNFILPNSTPNHTVDLNSTVSLEMIWVEPGTFTMGSPETEVGRNNTAGRETEHEVTLTNGFYLGKYEVTQAQYEAVMTGNDEGLSATPSYFNGYPNRPVEKVSWDDIQVFLTRLNAQESGNIPAGWAYVLPTEAQWSMPAGPARPRHIRGEIP